ncbi:hypothetical protein CFter6_3834 [Collimonas fungivorans]|uniref:Uncharacterized protein n=1 Tax=Collimonas fungivorans TaxID=158899 RepID=A0A127PFP4_9BURK|nr:hypothetical protein CFter6_3834 [Collimonas fungivorans]
MRLLPFAGKNTSTQPGVVMNLSIMFYQRICQYSQSDFL